MSVEVPRINTHAFTIGRQDGGGVKIGMSLTLSDVRDKMSVDLARSLNISDESHPSAVWLEESLVKTYLQRSLGVPRINQASIPAERSGSLYIPQAPYRLSTPRSDAAGVAAIVGMHDTAGFTHISGNPEDPTTAPLLDQQEIALLGGSAGKALLFFLQVGQEIKVASGVNRDLRVYSVTFDPLKEDLIATDVDNPGSDGGSDRIPDRPLRPTGNIGARR